MNLSKVTGKVVSTQKDAGLAGQRLLIAQHARLPDMSVGANYVVAVDTVGAGVGDWVLIVTGSSARMAEGMKDCPVDSAIVAIVDSVRIEGGVEYSASAPVAAR